VTGRPDATGRCTVLDVERPVQVLHDGGRWVDGWVTAQRRDPDGWWGLVRYSTGVGEQYLHWRPASELRPTEPSSALTRGVASVRCPLSGQNPLADGSLAT